VLKQAEALFDSHEAATKVRMSVATMCVHVGCAHPARPLRVLQQALLRPRTLMGRACIRVAKVPARAATRTRAARVSASLRSARRRTHMVAMLGATSGSATSAASRVILLTSAQTCEPLVCGGCRRSLLLYRFALLFVQVKRVCCRWGRAQSGTERHSRPVGIIA